MDSHFKDSDPFEKLHVKFIKDILGVHCKASNDGCRAELNRIPLKNKILYSIFNYLNHIVSSENSLAYDIFTKSVDSNPWVIKVKSLLNELGMSCIINNFNYVKGNLNSIKQKIND